jgi:hypothetical protein
MFISPEAKEFHRRIAAGVSIDTTAPKVSAPAFKLDREELPW